MVAGVGEGDNDKTKLVGGFGETMDQEDSAFRVGGDRKTFRVEDAEL